MSIQRIGRDGLNPLVLMNLTGPERWIMARLLARAEVSLGEIPVPERGPHGYHMVAAMIRDLREACDLAVVRPAAESTGQAAPEVDWAELLRYAGEWDKGFDEAADARHRAVFAQLKRWLAVNGHAS